jgi:hypothetical protein
MRHETVLTGLAASAGLAGLAVLARSLRTEADG